MIEKIINWISEYKIWIVGVVILSMVTIGYDYLETTSFYDDITGTKRLKSAIEMLYSSDPGFQHGLFFNSATSSREFASLARLVQSEGNTTSDLVPTFILRMAIKNAPYINIPLSLDETSRYISDLDSKQLILGTDFSPAILGSCPRLPLESLNFPMCKVRNIGNKYNLEQQIEERKKLFRFKVNIVATLLGVLLSIPKQKKVKV